MNEQHKEEAINKLLELSKKEKNIKQKQRYDAALLFLEGYKRKEISAVLHIPKRTSDNYIYLYQQGGTDALLIKKQPGYKKKLTDEQEKELLNIISAQTPYEAGIGVFANWTAFLACRLVAERFKVEYSDSGMRDLFKRIGLSYTRPTYKLAKADPEKQEAFKTEFETIKKKLLNDEINTVLFEDESMIRDYQAIMKTWFPKGQQRIIPTYGKHEGVKLVGCLDYETGYIYVEEHKNYNAEAFLKFLKNVLKQYPTGKIVIILDNAKIHHAKLLKDFLASNKARLELVFLPPYSPNLNKIEKLWRWLKDAVINNIFFHSVEDIKKAVEKFINWVNTVPNVVIDRLCL